MRVLVCGGKKTINIVKSLNDRFTSGSIEITMENEVSNIESFLSRGDYFDRALIIEQSWTSDGTVQDETIIRKKINDFVGVVRQRCNKDATCIFIATSEKMARIAAEETLDIHNMSSIVLKEPPYAVSFFTTLVTSDLQDIPKNYLFNISDIQDEGMQLDDMEDSSIEQFDTFGEKLGKAKDINVSKDDIETGKSNIEKGKESKPAEITDLDDELFNTGLDNGASDDEIDEFENEGNIDNGIDILEEDDNDAIEIDDTTDNEIDQADNDTTDNEEITENNEDDTNEEEEAEEIAEDSNNTAENNDDAHGRLDTTTNSEDTDNTINVAELFAEEDDNTEDTQLQEVKAKTKVDDTQTPSKQQTNNTSTRLPTGFTAEVYKKPLSTDNTEDVQSGVQTSINASIKEKGSTKSKRYTNINKPEDISQLLAMMNTFSSKGNSIVITGAGASGTSTIAFNLANTVVKLGYTALIVDFDTIGRAQAYISKDAYEAVHSQDTSNPSLKMALNDPNNGIGRYVNIIAPGFHILTMGLAGDIVQTKELAEKSKLIRFANVVRNNYNFIIYDMPFRTAVDYCSDITYTSDNIVLTIDSSNWGIMKALLAICNIDNKDMQEVIFSRAQICFTKYIGFKNVLGRPIKNDRDILIKMDELVKDLLGVDPEYLFSNMGMCEALPYDQRYENCWFNHRQYSDYEDGYNRMLRLIQNILLKR